MVALSSPGVIFIDVSNVLTKERDYAPDLQQ